MLAAILIIIAASVSLSVVILLILYYIGKPPDGNDKVSRLIDAYLTAFQRRIAAEDAGGPSPQAPVPEGFDVRDFV